MNAIKKLLVVIFLASILVGCHTVQGAGEDISAGGHAVTRAAS